MVVAPFDSLAPGDRAMLETWVDVRATVARADLGDHASPFTTEEVLAVDALPTTRRRYCLAGVGDEVAGAGILVESLVDNRHLAFVGCSVLPSWRRHGVGTALAEAGEALARSGGRTVVRAQTAWVAGGTDTSGEGFAASRGYAPALTMLQNELDLTRPHGEASGAADPDPAYEIDVAVGALPEEWLADRATLQARMSTDAPSGELPTEEERWDADRLRESVAATLRAGRTRVEAVARHRASGRLVAYSYVECPRATPELAYQEDTLVAREHRGHGLGIALKRELVRVLRAERPRVRTIRTWNATTNEPMLAVNTALGFRPVAMERDWHKAL